MKYFLIAGEASGDLHGAALIEALRRRDTDARFAFLGGDMMARAAGCAPVVHYRDMAFMGFTEVLRHLGKVRANFKAARRALASERPDRLILIDYPSFNLRMARHARKLGIPVSYYIPPKVWAWKEWRVRAIRRDVGQVFAIFPFEVDFYARHGVEAVYVGNPSVDEIDRALPSLPTREEFVKANALQDKPIVALLPGSRLAEIRDNLRIMTAVMRGFPQYRGVVAGAPGVDPSYYGRFTHLPVVFGQTYALLGCARAALVTSGTATLEAALIGTPQVALYYGGGSRMLYSVMKRVLKIPYVTLPNLIAGRQVIPELLLHLCTPEAAADELGRILPDRPARQEQLDGYALVREKLGTRQAPVTAAAIICGKSC